MAVTAAFLRSHESAQGLFLYLGSSHMCVHMGVPALASQPQ